MNLLNWQKTRDEALIERFCEKGAFLDDGGEVRGVCKLITIDELLGILHAFDEELLGREDPPPREVTPGN